MGVEFLNCEMCNDVFADCGVFFSCETCCKHFCSAECKGGSSEDSCIFCRKEDVQDSTLLYFLLKHYNISREKAFDLWRLENK